MRVKSGPKAKNRRRKVLKLTEGMTGRKRNANKVAQEALDRAMNFNYRHRKQLKRNMRQTWVTRLTAASRARGLSYSQVIGALNKANISINRKMLADLAATDPQNFNAVLKAAGIQIA